MKTIRQTLATLAVFALFAHPASANLTILAITPQNQKVAGLDFKLSLTEQPEGVYLVELRAPVQGKLSEFFGAGLFIGERTTSAKGLILDVPLQVKSKWEKDEVCALQFRINKELIGKSVIYFRCGTGFLEQRYEIAIQNYLPSK